MCGNHRRVVRRRVVIVALAVAVAGDLGACSSNPDGSATTTTTTTDPAADPTTTTAAAPATTERPAPATNVEIATINVLHGLTPPISGCEEYTDQCNIEARVEILWRYLEDDVGCPEIIALQEIAVRWFEVVPERLPDLCDGTHLLLTENLDLFDQEMILTTLPVIDDQRVDLAGTGVWSAHWAQLDAGDGLLVDVFATHYASSAFNPPCSADAPATTCHPDCPAGSTLGDCHPRETLAFLAERGAPGALQLIVGDLNNGPEEPRLTTLTGAGFVDTYLAAGNPECPDGGGAGCTSGIGRDADTDYDGLDVADTVLRGRIDFVLARPPSGCTLVVDIDDADGDGTRTGHWADTPLDAPFEGLYWAADHAGIQADVGVDCA
jgi:hypothetical protein